MKNNTVKYTSNEAEEARNIIRQQVIAEIKEWAENQKQIVPTMGYSYCLDNLIEYLDKLTNQ